MNLTVKLTGIGTLFILVIITGIWLTREGKPYNPTLFNTHKLIALAGTLLTGILAYKLQQGIELSQFLGTLLIAAGIMFILLIVSGGLLNLEISFSKILKWIHRIVTGMAIIITTLLFYLLIKT